MSQIFWHCPINIPSLKLSMIKLEQCLLIFSLTGKVQKRSFAPKMLYQDLLYYLGQGIPVTFDDQRFFLPKENSKRSPESPISYSASGERDKIYVILPFPPLFLSELCRKYKNRCCHVIVYILQRLRHKSEHHVKV